MLYGEQTEVINVKISTSKLSALGIDPTSIMGILQKQNIQVNTGDIATEIYQLRLRTEGTYTSLEDIENQLNISKDGREARLGDIATVERGYYDPPSTLMRVTNIFFFISFCFFDDSLILFSSFVGKNSTTVKANT